MYERIKFALLFGLTVILFPGFEIHSRISADHSVKSTNAGLQPSRIELPGDLPQTGDLVFRRGRGWLSDVISSFSKHKPEYSHVGLIHREGETVYVYHILGGENSGPNDVRKDLLSDFVSRKTCSSYGLYRYPMREQSIRKLDSLSGVLFQTGKKFDTQFDLSDDSKYYCTEMIYRLLSEVYGGEYFLPLSVYHGQTYIACDDLFNQPSCREIYMFQYE